MKVLFAFNNEKQVDQLAEFYKKTYGEKLEVTKVYFFRALIETLRKNKNFDRIVIHEEVEPFGSKNQDAIDKYLFNNLDKASDEAGKADIIIVCSERRQQNDKFVKNLFNLGIYNVLTGQDRTVGNLSELINKPRTKKEAKMFVDADLEENPYEANDKVDELELRNIIKYFEKNIFSKDKIVAGFESLYEQYTFDKIKEQIVPVIPIKAREILEQHSQKYVMLMAYKPPKAKKGETVKIVEVPVYIQKDEVKKPDEPPVYKPEPVNEERPKPVINSQVSEKPKIKYVQPVEEVEIPKRSESEQKYNIKYVSDVKPEVPKVEVAGVKKFDESFVGTGKKNVDEPQVDVDVKKFGDIIKPSIDEVKEKAEEEAKKKAEEERLKLEEEAKKKAEEERLRLEEEAKKKAEEERLKLEEETKKKAEEERLKLEEETKKKAEEERLKLEEETKKKAEEERLRLEEEAKKKAEEERLRLEEEAKKKAEKERLKLEEEAKKKAEEERLRLEEEAKKKAEEERLRLEEEAKKKAEEERIRQEEAKKKAEAERIKLEEEAKKKAEEEERKKRELETKRTAEPEILKPTYASPPRFQPPRPMPEEPRIQTVTQVIEKEVIKEVYDTPRDYKKAVCFVGAHKTGTTFIINAIANVLAGRGVNVAILDLTYSKDSYLIYTNKDLDQKEVAANSLNNLAIGQDKPFKLGHLSIYTGIPRTSKNKLDVYKAIEIAKREHSVVLIDCDFVTKKDAPDVFRYAQSIYVVQDMDTLNILPITMFLKELKSADVDTNKISVIINKHMKSLVKVDDILGSLAYYTSPDFSVMEENLLPKNVKRFIVPFDEQNYLRYIENVSTGKMNFAGFSEDFKQAISIIIQDVFPIGSRPVSRPTEEGGFIKSIFKKR